MTNKQMETKYNIIFFRDIFNDGNDKNMFTMLRHDIEGVEVETACFNEEENCYPYQFSQSEINEIIKERPEYSEIIKKSMVKVKEENLDFE